MDRVRRREKSRMSYRETARRRDSQPLHRGRIRAPQAAPGGLVRKTRRPPSDGGLRGTNSPAWAGAPSRPQPWTRAGSAFRAWQGASAPSFVYPRFREMAPADRMAEYSVLEKQAHGMRGRGHE